MSIFFCKKKDFFKFYAKKNRNCSQLYAEPLQAYCFISDSTAEGAVSILIITMVYKHCIKIKIKLYT